MRILRSAVGGADSPGEQAVAQSLAGALDDAYALFRSVRLPRAEEPIDAVLVGPSGVLVMTIYEYVGTYACDGDDWFHSPDSGQSWQPSVENPVKQVLYDHIQLKAHLAQENLRDVPFEQAVVFPNAKTHVNSRNPAVRLLWLKELPAYARELTGQSFLAPAQVNDVVAALVRTVVSLASPASSASPASQPSPRRADRSLLPWLIALAVLLTCNGAVCLGFVLAWLLKK